MARKHRYGVKMYFPKPISIGLKLAAFIIGVRKTEKCFFKQRH